MNRHDYCGTRNCFHCNAAMEEYAKTPSGRIVYRCPDCGRQQFYDGAIVPHDVPIKRVERERGEGAKRG